MKAIRTYKLTEHKAIIGEDVEVVTYDEKIIYNKAIQDIINKIKNLK